MHKDRYLTMYDRLDLTDWIPRKGGVEKDQYAEGKVR
jgi:hypothetical protein